MRPGSAQYFRSRCVPESLSPRTNPDYREWSVPERWLSVLHRQNSRWTFPQFRLLDTRCRSFSLVSGCRCRRRSRSKGSASVPRNGDPLYRTLSTTTLIPGFTPHPSSTLMLTHGAPAHTVDLCRLSHQGGCRPLRGIGPSRGRMNHQRRQRDRRLDTTRRSHERGATMRFGLDPRSPRAACTWTRTAKIHNHC